VLLLPSAASGQAAVVEHPLARALGALVRAHPNEDEHSIVPD
jgi:hypothetical protein